MAEVVLTDVVKTYGTVTAVDNVSLTMEDGEFVTLVGPSGCGKTTTLNLIAGLLDITSGTIAIGGRVINDLDPKDRDIAMVFQNYALYPHKSVYENLAFPLQDARREEGRDRAQGAGGGGEPRHQGIAGSAAARALRRSAAARRARPRGGAEPAGLPDGRAALQPRRQAARPDARGDQATAPRPQCDRRLRHARPVGSDDDERPRRGDGRRAPSISTARRWRSSTRPRTSSSPPSSARPR